MNSTSSNSPNAIKNAFNKTGNTVKTGYKQFQGLSLLSQVFSVIITLAVVGLLIYLVYYFMYDMNGAGSPVIIDKPVNAFDETISSKNVTLPSASEGLAFTYNFWMYIADWQYNFGKTKTIFVRGTDDNPSPGVYLYPEKNSMAVRLGTFEMPQGEGCDVDNIPLQKWVNVAVVLNNRTMDIYVDGKLERSCVLRGVPRINRAPLKLAQNGGFYGQLARFQYFNRAITVDEVHQIYRNGPF